MSARASRSRFAHACSGWWGVEGEASRLDIRAGARLRMEAWVHRAGKVTWGLCLPLQPFSVPLWLLVL